MKIQTLMKDQKLRLRLTTVSHAMMKNKRYTINTLIVKVTLLVKLFAH